MRGARDHATTSLPVRTVTTSDIAGAAVASTETISACASGERSTAAWAVPGPSPMSSVKRPRPASSAASSTRSTARHTRLLTRIGWLFFLYVNFDKTFIATLRFWGYRSGWQNDFTPVRAVGVRVPWCALGADRIAGTPPRVPYRDLDAIKGWDGVDVWTWIRQALAA